MTEEHPRRRRALSWGEVPIKREAPPATVGYTPARSSGTAKVWVEFPTNLTSSILLARDESLIKHVEERIKAAAERNRRERQEAGSKPNRG